MTKPRAAIYARVSTADQNPQMQLDVLREFAGFRGFDVVAEHVDHGVSGTTTSRPALDTCMDAARKGAYDVILVYRFDRFARSLKHLVTALAEFDSLGVSFVSYSENLDTTTPLGRAMFAICGALAQLERDLIVERSVEGQRRAKARGVHVGRPRTDVDVAYVRFLRDHAGLTIRAIAAKLDVGKNIVSRALKEAEAEAA